MAKPLGPKSSLIRDAINAHPDTDNKELAEMINASPARAEDEIEVKPAEIAQQRQLMRKAAAKAAAGSSESPAAPTAAENPARAKRARRPAATGAARTRASGHPAVGSPVEIVDRLFELAELCGGLSQLKYLVDRFYEREQR